MRIKITQQNEATEREIHGFQVIKKDIKIFIKVGEKTTVESTNMKEIHKREIELEEELIKLGKNMIVVISNRKKEIFKYEHSDYKISVDFGKNNNAKDAIAFELLGVTK